MNTIAYAQEGYIDISKGGKLYYQAYGTGAPIVVLHGGPGLSQGYLLPYMAELAKKNQVIFLVGDSYLSSRLIEGHFPNYEQVIPKEEKTTSLANREELLQAVRRTSLLTSPDSPAVKLDFVKGKILISSRSPNLGEAKEELLAESKGSDVAIGFNPQYLMDVLKNLDIDKVSLSLSDPDKPGLLKGKEGYLYVIMPMQLN